MQSKVIIGKTARQHCAPILLLLQKKKILKCLSFCIISDCVRHDTKTVHAFTCKVISYIKDNLHAITKVLYFSDGAASQYKNFKNFVNLCYHEINCGIQAQWHFFATSHGKSPCDGIGGTTKRLVAREILQGTENSNFKSL